MTGRAKNQALAPGLAQNFKHAQYEIKVVSTMIWRLNGCAIHLKCFPEVHLIPFQQII